MRGFNASAAEEGSISAGHDISKADIQLGDMPVDWQSGSKVHLASHQRQKVVAVVIMLRRGIAVSRISRKMPACGIVTCAGLFSILKFVHE